MGAMGIARVEAVELWRTVIEPPGNLVKLRMERAAQGDVQFLNAAADREHRQIGLHCCAQERQRDRIARRVVKHAGRIGRAPVMMRLDIGGRTRHQQPVDPRQHRLGGIGTALGGHEQRQAAGTSDHCIDVFRHHRMSGMRPRRRHDLAPTALDGDDGERCRACGFLRHDRHRPTLSRRHGRRADADRSSRKDRG